MKFEVKMYITKEELRKKLRDIEWDIDDRLIGVVTRHIKIHEDIMGKTANNESYRCGLKDVLLLFEKIKEISNQFSLEQGDKETNGT